jgi:hypothetical protein
LKRIAYILLLTGLFACGDEEKTANNPPVAQFEFVDGIDRINLDGEISTELVGLCYSDRTFCLTRREKGRRRKSDRSQTRPLIALTSSILQGEAKLENSDNKLGA